jgi:hypothetical protein
LLPSPLIVSTYNSKTLEWGVKEFATKREKALWLREVNKYPGEFGFDERIKVFYEQATRFEKDGYYTDVIKGTFDYREYWDRQKELCYTGILVDDQYYISGDHYWYLNFLTIPVKDGRGDAFPRFQDLDVWAFNCFELAVLEGKDMVCLKARQTGFTLKLLSRMAKRFWFERKFSGKYAAYEEKYIESAWKEILVPYRNHLLEHTAWSRSFQSGDEQYRWKQQREVNQGGKKFYKGLLSTLKAMTTKVKASAVVSGKTDEAIYDEAGVSMNVDKVKTLLDPTLRDGNKKTGHLWIVGAAGEMKESEAIQKMFFSPRIYGCLEFPNIWSGRPDEMVGMFVPYYYSYGDCVDEWGNSDIAKAKIAFEEHADLEKQKGFTEYAIFRAQHPATPEDAFSIQEENIFPVEKIFPHYERLLKSYKDTVVTLVDDLSQPTGINHTFGSISGVVKDFPVKADTDRRGALVVDEFPEKDPPLGLYYVTVDPIRQIQTSTSQSLQSVTVYKAAHRIDNEFSEDKPVAWYCGRNDDPVKTYELTKKIMKRWNARTAIESDQSNCIEWMIKEKMQRYMMKRSDIPILKDLVPSSSIHQEYGFRTGSGNNKIKDYFNELIIEYCNEVIGTEFDDDGNSREIYGVTRIKDVMLLKELLNFNPRKGNYDRIISFGAALMVARANTNRGIMAVRRSERTEPPPPIRSGLSQQFRVMPSPFAPKQRKTSTYALRKL